MRGTADGSATTAHGMRGTADGSATTADGMPATAVVLPTPPGPPTTNRGPPDSSGGPLRCCPGGVRQMPPPPPPPVLGLTLALRPVLAVPLLPPEEVAPVLTVLAGRRTLPLSALLLPRPAV